MRTSSKCESEENNELRDYRVNTYKKESLFFFTLNYRF